MTGAATSGVLSRRLALAAWVLTGAAACCAAPDSIINARSPTGVGSTGMTTPDGPHPAISSVAGKIASTGSDTSGSSGRGHELAAILAPTMSVALAVLLWFIAMLGLWIYCRRKRKRDLSSSLPDVSPAGERSAGGRARHAAASSHRDAQLPRAAAAPCGRRLPLDSSSTLESQLGLTHEHELEPGHYEQENDHEHEQAEDYARGTGTSLRADRGRGYGGPTSPTNGTKEKGYGEPLSSCGHSSGVLGTQDQHMIGMVMYPSESGGGVGDMSSATMVYPSWSQAYFTATSPEPQPALLPRDANVLLNHERDRAERPISGYSSTASGHASSGGASAGASGGGGSVSRAAGLAAAVSRSLRSSLRITPERPATRGASINPGADDEDASGRYTPVSPSPMRNLRSFRARAGLRREKETARLVAATTASARSGEPGRMANLAVRASAAVEEPARPTGPQTLLDLFVPHDVSNPLAEEPSRETLSADLAPPRPSVGRQPSPSSASAVSYPYLQGIARSASLTSASASAGVAQGPNVTKTTSAWMGRQESSGTLGGLTSAPAVARRLSVVVEPGPTDAHFIVVTPAADHDQAQSAEYGTDWVTADEPAIRSQVALDGNTGGSYGMSATVGPPDHSQWTPPPDEDHTAPYCPADAPLGSSTSAPPASLVPSALLGSSSATPGQTTGQATAPLHVPPHLRVTSASASASLPSARALPQPPPGAPRSTLSAFEALYRSSYTDNAPADRRAVSLPAESSVGTARTTT